MKSGEIKEIKEYSLFKGLSARELKLISGIVNKFEINAGSIVIREGDFGEDLYLLEEGIVEICKTLTLVTSKHDFGTKERTFIRLTGEDRCFFGEMVLLGNGERSATVKALTNCTLFEIKKDNFRYLCESEPRIGYIVLTNIALMLADYLRKTNEDVVKLTTALSLALSGEQKKT